MTCSRQPRSTVLRSIVGVTIGLAALMRSADALGEKPLLTEVVVNDSAGRARQVAKVDVYTFERDLQKLIAMPGGPKEIFALATSAAVDLLVPGGDRLDEAREMLIVLVFENGAEFRWLSEYAEKQRQWRLEVDQVKAIRDFVVEHRVDELPPLESPRQIGGKARMIVGGTIHVYLHLDSKACRRVYINNPPLKGEGSEPADDPSWKYTELIELFERLKNARRASRSESAQGSNEIR